jgi:V8-like Glu-specific endopeptidase
MRACPCLVLVGLAALAVAALTPGAAAWRREQERADALQADVRVATDKVDAARPIGLEWNAKSLGGLAAALGGTVAVAERPKTYTDAVGVAERFERAPADFKAHLGVKPLQFPGDDRPVRFLAYDGRAATSVALPRESVARFVAGVDGTARNADHAPEHEGHANAAGGVGLVEEAAAAGARRVLGKGAPWKKITGAAMDEFPSNSVVQMQYRLGGEAAFVCTGTVIDWNLVLTAAHCVYHPTEGLLDLSEGRMEVVWKRDGPSLDDAATRRTVTSYSVFEGYSADPFFWEVKESGDVAVLVFGGEQAPHGYVGFRANAYENRRRKGMTREELVKSNHAAMVHLTSYPAGPKTQGRHMYCDECRPTFNDGDSYGSHTCDTEKGSSGGGLWYHDTSLGPAVVGVNSVSRQYDNGFAVLTKEVGDFLLLAKKMSRDP